MAFLQVTVSKNNGYFTALWQGIGNFGIVSENKCYPIKAGSHLA